MNCAFIPTIYKIQKRIRQCVRFFHIPIPQKTATTIPVDKISACFTGTKTKSTPATIIKIKADEYIYILDICYIPERFHIFHFVFSMPIYNRDRCLVVKHFLKNAVCTWRIVYGLLSVLLSLIVRSVIDKSFYLLRDLNNLYQTLFNVKLSGFILGECGFFIRLTRAETVLDFGRGIVYIDSRMGER